MTSPCWICQRPADDTHPLIQLEPSIPSLACTRHLPVVDATPDESDTYAI